MFRWVGLLMVLVVWACLPPVPNPRCESNSDCRAPNVCADDARCRPAGESSSSSSSSSGSGSSSGGVTAEIECRHLANVETCTSPSFCCIGWTQEVPDGECLTEGSACSRNAFYCDDERDCGGMICCWEGNTAVCKSAGDCTGEELCTTDTLQCVEGSCEYMDGPFVCSG